MGVSSVVPGCRDSRGVLSLSRLWGRRVVVDHVGADRLPRLVESLELVAPDAAFLELAEPGLDERLAVGVAEAARRCAIPRPASTDLNARAVNAEPLSVASVSMPGAITRSEAAGSIRPRWGRRRSPSQTER